MLKNVCQKRFPVGLAISCEFSFFEILIHTLYLHVTFLLATFSRFSQRF